MSKHLKIFFKFWNQITFLESILGSTKGNHHLNLLKMISAYESRPDFSWLSEFPKGTI